MKKTVIAIILALVLIFTVGCGSFDFSDDTGQYIVTAKQALSMMEDKVVLVAACEADDYARGHIDGAINIPMSALTVDEPYKNMLPSADTVADVMSAAGVTENDTLLVYDNNNNMSAARIQWTLNVYNNFNVKVISGGMNALTKAGKDIVVQATVRDEAVYVAGDKQKKLIVTYDYINILLDKDDGMTVIIDTRSNEEYYQGTIPGSLHLEYILNNYASGEYKSVRDLQSTYINKKILPDQEKTYVLFCKTSVRAAEAYTAMKDMGFIDVRIYDGAWVEWIDINGQPDAPTETVVPTVQDAS